MKVKGFTLLELMLVVGIIGILSSIGIPAYISYMQRGKMGTARAYVDSYNSQVLDFYRDHGSFPTNTNLSVSSAVPTSLSQYLYQPYVAYVTFSPQPIVSGKCPYTINTGYFSNYQGDYFSNGTSKYVVYNNFLIDNNGTMVTECSFYEFDPVANQVTTNNLFPECALDQNSTAIMSFINSACG